MVSITKGHRNAQFIKQTDSSAGSIHSSTVACTGGSGGCIRAGDPLPGDSARDPVAGTNVETDRIVSIQLPAAG